MKPIWIVDDDPSIRFVLEKALAREGLSTRSFSHPREVLDAMAAIAQGVEDQPGPQVLVIGYPHAGCLGPAVARRSVRELLTDACRSSS
jgi:two-component system nitrogen regulation response regulator GlnG